MKEPDLEKYAQEVNEIQNLPAATVELPPLAALAIIFHIQLAIRHPGIADSEFAKIAIDVAKQLQNLFNQDSETYKVLELGWNPEADILTPSEEFYDKFCDEPCTDPPVSEMRDKDPQLLEAIRTYFLEREGIDLDADSDCEEPCDKFLQNLGCRCTGNRVAEIVAGDEQISPQTLAAGAAMMHQLKQSLESEGFELLDT